MSCGAWPERFWCDLDAAVEAAVSFVASEQPDPEFFGRPHAGRCQTDPTRRARLVWKVMWLSIRPSVKSVFITCHLDMWGLEPEKWPHLVTLLTIDEMRMRMSYVYAPYWKLLWRQVREKHSLRAKYHEVVRIIRALRVERTMPSFLSHE